MASSPAIVGDELVVHGMDGIVRVLDRRNGGCAGTSASARRSSRRRSSPGGLDYFGAWNGRVYALDLKRRKLRWSFRTGQKITSSAAIAGRTLYIGDYGGRLHALATRTGKRRFVRSVNGRVYGTPAVAAGRVFVPSSTGNSLTAFTTSGRYLWRVGTGGYVYSSPAVWAGRVFFALQRPPLLRLGAERPRALERRRGRARLRRRGRRRRRRLRGLTWGRITGVDAKSGRVVLSASPRRVRPGLRHRPPAAPARLFARLGSSSRSNEEVDRGARRADPAGRRRRRRLRRLQEGSGKRRSRLLDGRVRHDRGTRSQAASGRPARWRVAWPTFHYDASRVGVSPYGHRPPYKVVWGFAGRSLVEFPPAVAFGRLYLYEQCDGVPFAVCAGEGRQARVRRYQSGGWWRRRPRRSTEGPCSTRSSIGRSSRSMPRTGSS